MGTFTASFDLGMLAGSPAVGAAAALGGYSAAFYLACAAALACAARLGTCTTARSAAAAPGGDQPVPRPQRAPLGSHAWPERDTSTSGESGTIDRKLINKLTEAQMARFREHTPTSARVLRPRPQGDAGRRPLLVPAQRPMAGLHRARQGRAGLGRRRQRVRRLPQRLRGDVHRARQPDRRRGGQGPPRPGNPLRRPHQRLDRGRREAGERFGLPQWRFTNSGTESTMSAIHLARGATDRDVHHQDRGLLRRPPRRGDGLLLPGPRRARPPREPQPVPFGAGYPEAIVELTRPVPFNDARGRWRACSRDTRARSPG